MYEQYLQSYVRLCSSQQTSYHRIMNHSKSLFLMIFCHYLYELLG